jgi:hypothetical protein
MQWLILAQSLAQVAPENLRRILVILQSAAALAVSKT